ncbi:PREDICTED: phosphonoacetaldehyde hydrolase-like [Priapulus caudatus]|uniref:Phosphonoacetaldehyde hydrolase-like n=1 Tax=Priapulus caudatus TaxID=37621 RepID=A0ABM1EUL3_PRICU|nr:PREDICTED: phosphonoacetaldehyde hydrolase-like [Priapulus caudatus]
MSAMSQYYRFTRTYIGPLKACLLDWSGTTADKYVIAPAVVFQDVFKKHKVPISMLEAREPMGLRKDLHILEITRTNEVRERWFSVHAKYPEQAEVDAMFADFVPMQLECLSKYTKLIPGAAEAVKTLRNQYGLKIGSTTGFTRPMVDILERDAKKQGLTFDCTVAGDEVTNGSRPKPHMVFRNMDLLDVHPVQAVLKVDDTVSGIGEALAAGCWGVGVARYSNYMHINSLGEEKHVPETEIRRRLEHSRDLLRKAGSHYVVDSIADLPEVVEKINARLANGEKP